MNTYISKIDPYELITQSFNRRSPLGRFFDLPDIGLGEQGSFPIDIEEFNDNYKICADLPGYSKEDIGIDLEDNLLTISTSRSSESAAENPGRFVRRERSLSDFSRSFHLPKDIDEGSVSARLDNGVLELTLPKSAASAKKRITVG